MEFFQKSTRDQWGDFLIQSEVVILIFDNWNKSRSRFPFLIYVCKNINFYKRPQSTYWKKKRKNYLFCSESLRQLWLHSRKAYCIFYCRKDNLIFYTIVLFLFVLFFFSLFFFFNCQTEQEERFSRSVLLSKSQTFYCSSCENLVVHNNDYNEYKQCCVTRLKKIGVYWINCSTVWVDYS